MVSGIGGFGKNLKKQEKEKSMGKTKNKSKGKSLAERILDQRNSSLNSEAPIISVKHDDISVRVTKVHLNMIFDSRQLMDKSLSHLVLDELDEEDKTEINLHDGSILELSPSHITKAMQNLKIQEVEGKDADGNKVIKLEVAMYLVFKSAND